MKTLASIPPLWIFDLDGTLAFIEHRRHFIANDNPDWGAFNRACVDDEPNMPVIRMFRVLIAAGHDVLIWTGRSESVRPETLRWLNDNVQRGLNFNGMLTMRPEDDTQPDDSLKVQWLRAMPAALRATLVGVFDDRDSVVRMWRSEGVTCFQVADGDF